MGQAFPEQRDATFVAFITDYPCLVCRRSGVDPAHVIPVARGAPDRGNIVPLCRMHHDEQEGKTAEFERRYIVALRGHTLAWWAWNFYVRYTQTATFRETRHGKAGSGGVDEPPPDLPPPGLLPLNPDDVQPWPQRSAPYTAPPRGN